jgi:hypothetical protein
MVEKHGETDTDIHAHKQESADCLAAVSIKFLIRILCPVLPRISDAVMEGDLAEHTYYEMNTARRPQNTCTRRPCDSVWPCSTK